MFMARAVRKGGPLGEVGKSVVYSGVPELSELARVTYEKMFPDRLVHFPNSPDCTVTIKDNERIWRHELRHDAESAFWLLVWWALKASPKDGVMTYVPYSTRVAFQFANSTTQSDRRHNIADLVSDLDPLYLPLNDLLKELVDALIHDLHWATEEPQTHPEYLHEVFQRHILNFIFANQGKDFMNLPKTDTPRFPLYWWD
jgi:hypothetical protein